MEKAVKRICGLSITLYVVLNTKFEFVDAVSYSISISVFLYLLYDKWLWRFDPFNTTPQIYGCYKNSVISTYGGGVNYESLVFVKQTLSKIIITEKMDEGICISVVSSLYKCNEDDTQWFLNYTYLTHPKKPEDDMHLGTSILYIKDSKILEGFYYTNRIQQTKGEQKMVKINNKVKP